MAKNRWNYGEPSSGKDARKIVTLEQDGMRWVGIRAYNGTEDRWYNGNEPDVLAKVVAWQDLPTPSDSFWSRGIHYAGKDAEASA